MKIGIRITIAGMVLAAIATSTAFVHVVWWRTAERTSRDLASTINQQIVLSVTQQLSAITTEARAAYTPVRTLFLQNVLETTEAAPIDPSNDRSNGVSVPFPADITHQNARHSSPKLAVFADALGA